MFTQSSKLTFEARFVHPEALANFEAIMNRHNYVGFEILVEYLHDADGEDIGGNCKIILNSGIHRSEAMMLEIRREVSIMIDTLNKLAEYDAEMQER